MFTLPNTQFGVLGNEESSRLQTFDVPLPDSGEVLIRNGAVASNPKDWKHPKRHNNFSYIEGSDVAGEVVKVGDGVTEYKVGERVAAFTKMDTQQNKVVFFFYGGYAQYSVAPVATTIPLPDSTSFEAGSTLPLAVFTAAIGLFVNLGLKEPISSGTAANGDTEGIIVYGASSSVGAYVVQLAKSAGYFVVGVAGSSSDYVTSLGADVVIDYRAHNDAQLEDALVKALSGYTCSTAYDAIVAGNSTVTLARAVAKTSPNGSGKVTHILPLSDDLKKQFPSNVAPVHTYVGTAFSKDEAFCTRFSQLLVSLLVSPTRPFQPNRVKLMPNGLASVGEGLELLKGNKVHGEKLVYRIADTPKAGGA
ncbi:hypothetical protein EW145_g6757 [Phellinidium pouzarii]|uniref:Enoyl reductase (ER) domain-containing protein n=1 Tax=Phellinidium pouzarii TaxID=167371 RepID=A0A4S4KUH1_9AGAM|nr:hypothetical protein EW145_g6757 [Phellinidium pouzarii]